MAKYTGEQKIKEDQIIGKEVTELPVIQSDKSEKKYDIVFKENRSFELKLGHEFLMFKPYGINPFYPEKYTGGITKEIIEHPDFESHKNYFNIIER